MGDDGLIRLAFFFGVLAAVAIGEVAAPRRRLTDSKGRRWFANLSLVAIDTAVVRLALTVLPLDMAIMAQERGWGLLNTLTLPPLGRNCPRILPCWDRLAGTYRSQPEGGHDGMTIGLREFRDPAMLTLPRLLIQPFRRASDEKRLP
jgi:hypothetical protein